MPATTTTTRTTRTAPVTNGTGRTHKGRRVVDAAPVISPQEAAAFRAWQAQEAAKTAAEREKEAAAKRGWNVRTHTTKRGDHGIVLEIYGQRSGLWFAVGGTTTAEDVAKATRKVCAILAGSQDKIAAAAFAAVSANVWPPKPE